MDSGLLFFFFDDAIVRTFSYFKMRHKSPEFLPAWTDGANYNRSTRLKSIIEFLMLKEIDRFIFEFLIVKQTLLFLRYPFEEYV